MSVVGLMEFVRPTGLRSGTISTFEFEIVNRALVPVHLLAFRSGSNPRVSHRRFCTRVRVHNVGQLSREGREFSGNLIV